MKLHSTLHTTLMIACGLLAGCWNGESSLGLPCDDNLQCGLGIECINRFCGGEPRDDLCGNGYVDPGEVCDNGEQNAVNAVCLPDCTAQMCGDGVVGGIEVCDDGELNSNQGACKPDCTPAVCGDGLLGPDEDCDDGNAVIGDGCSLECRFEECGNGILDPNEDCDDGSESPTCDDDCTAVECGDANLNEAAGEACDNDSPAADDYDCLRNCTVPILWDDMEPDTPDVDWSHEVVSSNLEVPIMDTWAVTTRSPHGDSMRSWDSGQPAPSFGDTRLMTPTIDLGPYAGEVLELRFDHSRMFVDCNEPTQASEGAVVEVSENGGPFEIIVPDDGYSGPVGDGLCMDNPLDGQQAFTLDVDYTTETFDLSPYAGSSIVIGFRVGWDCLNCPPMEYDQSGRGWFIDNVAVSRE